MTRTPKPSPVIQRERFSASLVDELTPLLNAHYAEVSPHPHIPIDPDIDRYILLEEAGILRVYIARVGGEVAGYLSVVVGPSLHSRHSLRATQDVLYVSESYRDATLGPRLLHYVEGDLKKIGVAVIHHHVTVARDFGAILRRQGYELVEWVYAKQL